jgi:hypothetical protein
MNSTDLFSGFVATLCCVDEDKHRLQKTVLQVFQPFYFSKKIQGKKKSVRLNVFTYETYRQLFKRQGNFYSGINDRLYTQKTAATLMRHLC